MKDDAPTPEQIPSKKRALEAALDRWLREWLTKPDITFRERKRITAEMERRKALAPRVSVGIIVGREGTTPKQIHAIRKLLESYGPTEIHHTGVSSKLHTLCRSFTDHIVINTQNLGGKRYVERGNRDDDVEVIKESTVAIIAVKDTRKPERVEGLWELARYARNTRNIPVKVVMPDGELYSERLVRQ